MTNSLSATNGASLRILVIDGNTPEINEGRTEKQLPNAGEAYRTALLQSGVNAEIDILVAYDLANADHGRLTDRLSSYDGFALTGSGVDWGADALEARPYLQVLEQVFRCEKPVVGSCWGMQTTAVLFGGKSGINPAGTETGIARNITLTETGLAHHVYAGSSPVFNSVAIHRDHVTELPTGAKLLASNALSLVQGYAVETGSVDFIGFQYHPELTLSMVQQWHTGSPELPDTLEVHDDFPKSPPTDVGQDHIRILPLRNWMRHVADISNRAPTEAGTFSAA